MKTITITREELLDGREPVSASGMLIDEVAYSAGEWTSEEVDENARDYEHESVHYILDNFDYEDELLGMTRGEDDMYALADSLGVPVPTISHGNANKYRNLQAGARCALLHPTEWAALLAAYKDKCRDLSASAPDGELDKCAPNLANELRDAIDDYYQEARRTWLRGDRSYDGVLAAIAKKYGAETFDYSDNAPDICHFTFEDETLAEEVNDYYGTEKKMPSKKACKEWLINNIQSTSDYTAYKDRAERARREEEREHEKAYEQKRAEIAAQERRERLLALTK